MNRFFGGPPLAVLIRLGVTSVIVGIILSYLGINPQNLLSSLINFIWRIYNMGFDALEWAATYFILGALIVIPVWFLGRLWKTLGSGHSRGGAPRADDRL